ncbi:MAG TPA: elongation factor G [Mesorhizobium sp.]|jgi:elongation factor G|nr:elongation factor G [Mesorhizobium sp.]
MADRRRGPRASGPKLISIVGPAGGGKTTLLEALLFRAGAIPRQSQAGSGQTVGDFSTEARAHGMSVEASFASFDFMGDRITLADCPGSVEFACEGEPVLAASDAAIVVAEADPKKIPALQVCLRKLDELGVPRMLFLNKIDKAEGSVQDALQALQGASAVPLLLRQIPLRKDGAVVGSIDLALERAYVWRDGEPAEIVAIPEGDKTREAEARFSMLERLADHDDELMEQLLEDKAPPLDEVFDDLAADLREGAITPVFLGVAEKGHGVLRLLKAIRHDAPDVTATARRLGVPDGGRTMVQVLKTIHTSHAGKLSVCRVLGGSVADGAELWGPDGQSMRMGAVHKLFGREQTKLPNASAGDTVALGKLEGARTGQTLSGTRGAAEQLAGLNLPEPVFAISIRPRERKDDVKLSAAVQRLCEEDPSLQVRHDADSAETVLSGHGEMHLRVALERIEARGGIAVERGKPSVPYRETIKKPVSLRGRHKKQSGGHGQFGDVVLDIKPLPRGEGFRFTDTITGGVVPKQYIPSVEEGARDALKRGPLGFPVVDVTVNLADGSYHTVDSSDMAFQAAARLAIREALPQCGPVLLEPVMRVEIATPSDATARITSLVPQRRGQILGYDAREGWPGWDVVEALIPQAEMGDLIIELRSATAGAARFTAHFHHMAELTGRLAEEAAAAQNRAA